MLETEKTTKKSDSSWSVHYLHTYIQIIDSQARGFLSSFFFFSRFVYRREPCVIMWDRVTLYKEVTAKAHRRVCNGRGGAWSRHRLVSVSAPSRLAERAACSPRPFTAEFKCCVQVQSGGQVQFYKRKRESPTDCSYSRPGTRLLMQAVLFFFFLLCFFKGRFSLSHVMNKAQRTHFVKTRSNWLCKNVLENRKKLNR